MMFMPENQARCWTCGYQLRGLEQGICPECGRAFDPNDLSSFDRRDPVRLRRRRIRNVVLVLAALLFVAALWPVDLHKGRITLYCADCGGEQITYRWEPRLPGWIGIRLPGLHWRTGFLPDPLAKSKECKQHNFNQAKGEIGNQARGFRVSTTCDPGYEPLINDTAATLDTTVSILRQAMDPRNTTMSITCGIKGK